MKPRCEVCGHCTKYRIPGRPRRYECAFGVVSPYGICDRFQPDVSPSEIMRVIDREMKRLESFEDGKYQLKTYPDFGQNYRLIGDR